MTAPGDCEHIERTCALVDGELTGDAADAARDHLAGCAVCQAELADALQLDAAVAEHTRAVAQREAGVVSIAWYRRRPAQIATAAVAAAAAVVVYLSVPRHPAPTDPASPGTAVALALAPHRSLEARLAWPGAAGYRSYDVPRASEAPHETIALMAIAELDKRGDAHGVGVLELLNGERRQAATYLERAGDSADAISDRAALALADHRPERALPLADAALAADPHHGPALWNRALALRDLGLSRTAAAAFREVAARAEPGWAGEATQRATALDAETDALQQRFERINLASVALARGQIELSADDARAMPGFARGIFYDAIRSAATPAQLSALAPLAEALDTADHDTAMADALARAGKALHPALSRQYASMIRALAVEMQIIPNPGSKPGPKPGPNTGDDAAVPSGAARTQLLAALRAAHADDLLIGVLMKTSEDRRVVDRGEIAEFARLTAASPDPWMQLLGVQQQAEVLLQQDDLVGAEAVLLRGKQRCGEPGAPVFRCILLGKLLGKLYLEWQRLPEARAALSAAWQAAQASGEWIVQESLLEPLAGAAAIGDDTEASGLPLIRGYTEELTLRYPPSMPDNRCLRAEWGRTLRAMVLVNQLQFAAARRELAGPACAVAQPPETAVTHLFVRAELASHDGSPGEVAELRQAIAALRATPGLRPAEQIWLDHSEGRVVIDHDRAAGEALLRRAIATARQVPSSVIRAHKAAAWSYSVLITTAARHAEGAAALALLGEEQGLAVPARCVLGLAIEDQRRAMVIRDAAGKTMVHADDDRRVPAIDPAHLVPGDLVAALRGCPAVDVLARAPIHGMSRLLPADLAWRYLSLRSHPIAATAATATTAGPSLVVADVEPPPGLELPRLASWSPDPQAQRQPQRLTGAAATPSRVLAAIGAAGEAVIHAHGLVNVAEPDASLIALSPEPGGRFALTTGDVRKAQFSTSPLIILAACQASRAAPVWHTTWSLPAAFVYAGARAVIASSAPIPDGDAAAFFDGIRARVRAGAPVAIALRDARQQWLAGHRGDWVQDVIVFE
ncbi:MAG TPA: CHAT domain-containing protein [Kofleriaceae bacterium]|jgi:tetratricopeptide (TPR) repeat protein|nr:CHAT domain-containing protein [Kofleriaceae bacterium]